ncbi:hypothetical protein [Mycoplasmopsis primatum]|uniref:hypothetical protein n=1 Tax=Mycoplasmopsis primatum TaxID=55604 RepID=UPI000495FA3A|nr:hypothetical protein [Mycoplasmopsis primatum]
MNKISNYRDMTYEDFIQFREFVWDKSLATDEAKELIRVVNDDYNNDGPIDYFEIIEEEAFEVFPEIKECYDYLSKREIVNLTDGVNSTDEPYIGEIAAYYLNEEIKLLYEEFKSKYSS